MQTVIAKLCADFEFRRQYFSAPDEALRTFELTPEEIDNIKSLDMPLVRDYAFTLVAKRTELIKKWFPLTFKYLEARLPPADVRQLLHRYGTETYRDKEELGGEWIRGESERFYEYLRANIKPDRMLLPYFNSLLDYEYILFSMRTSLETYKSSAAAFGEANESASPLPIERLIKSKPFIGSHARVHWFDYEVSELVTAIEEGQPLPELSEEPIWMLFLRNLYAQAVTASVISPPLKELIELCTGEKTVDEIVSLIARKHAPSSEFSEDDLRSDCLDILGQLHEMRVLTFNVEEHSNLSPEHNGSGNTCSPTHG
jgi:hypothetical protein